MGPALSRSPNEGCKEMVNAETSSESSSGLSLASICCGIISFVSPIGSEAPSRFPFSVVDCGTVAFEVSAIFVPVQVDVLEDLRARGAPIAMPSDLRPATVLDAVVRAVRRQPAAEEV